jgi:hypothetical protein
MRKMIIILFIIVSIVGASHAFTYYDMGSPILSDIWVDPVNGIDTNSGLAITAPVKTITRAWSLIPSGSVLSGTGYRINLLPGSYPCEPGPEAENCINYFSEIKGAFQFPVIISAYNGPNTVTIRGGMNIDSVSYLYLVDLNLAGGTPLPTNSSGNNLLHIAGSDHILLKRLVLAGPSCDNDTCNNLQEVLKANQVQYLYVEDSTIGGAWHTSVDYMVVQYGHFLNNRVHTAGQWSMYLKGGSSYHRIEANEMYGCQLGFEAGQSANFAMMRSPWLHYDAYDIKFINNVLHDIPGVGMSASGGYNVLFAYNTLYKVGTAPTTGYPLMDAVQGERSCMATDELPDPVPRCIEYIAAGGWGPNFLTDSLAVVPNRKVYVYNNIFYNPEPDQTLYAHFDIRGSLVPPAGFINFPNPSPADDHLVFRGNVIWNGPADHPIGIEDSSQGCQNTNPTCNIAQIKADNAVNKYEPQLVDPDHGDFHPVSGGNIFSAVSYTIPDFTWADAPASPAVPQGTLGNTISVDRDSSFRTLPGPPGAYAHAAPATQVKFIGIWSDGIWIWNRSDNQWTKMPSTANAAMVAAGKVDTDEVDDVIGVWSSGIYIRQSTNKQWMKLSSIPPIWVTAGDLNKDGRDDVIASWKNDGVYFWEVSTRKWTKVTAPARQLAAGNIHGDGWDDLTGVWDNGLWVRIGATAGWQKIDATIPIWIAVGDMTGDNRADIIGSYSTGTWYRNSVSGAWSKITTPATQLTTGDIDNDGRNDLIGVWSDGVWVRYGATGKWQRISSTQPTWITTGRTADTAQTVKR